MLFTKEKVSEGQGRGYPGALSIRNSRLREGVGVWVREIFAESSNFRKVRKIEVTEPVRSALCFFFFF